jgi:predicted Zn finger-like uncharacterized protein
MMIVCPSCATSYMIDPASLGPAGRMVRCARCQTTWFADAPTSAPDVTAGAIAEAEAQSGGMPASPGSPGNDAPDQAASDDFGAEASDTDESSHAWPEWAAAEPPAGDPDLVPQEPEPVSIGDAPSLVPQIDHAPLSDASNAELDSEVIETFAARRKRLQSRRKKSRRSSRWTAIILVLLAFNVALIGARNEIVRYLPQTASLFSAIGLPVNLRHLKFENVHIAKQIQAGVTMLVIEGSIVSTASKPIEVPRLRFATRNASGREIYTWTALPSRSILGPGESLKFSSRLAAPPAGAHDVVVRFFTANDAMAGGK